MDCIYNRYNLEPNFREFLIAENISPLTIKNYLSDFRHFIGWLHYELKIQNEELIIENIDINVINRYKTYLTSNNLPLKTVNRRLSALRKFCSFCIFQGWIKENPAKKINNAVSSIKYQVLGINQNQILKQFKEYLLKQNIDQKTITDYLNNVSEFMSL